MPVVSESMMALSTICGALTFRGSTQTLPKQFERSPRPLLGAERRFLNARRYDALHAEARPGAALRPGGAVHALRGRQAHAQPGLSAGISARPGVREGRGHGGVSAPQLEHGVQET